MARIVLVAGPDGRLADAVVTQLLADGAVVERCDSDADVPVLMERHGRIDAAINLPAESAHGGAFHEQSEERFDAVLDAGATWTFRMMRAELRAMHDLGGSIVNLSSSAGLVGVAGSAIDAAAHHAVIGLTRTAALEYGGRGVRVNAVCPAFGDDPGPLGAISPEQVAASIVWLASPASGAVTGTCLQADGGQVETEGQLGKH